MSTEDITPHLVTPSNPPRTDLAGMDHARCAALHNHLLRLALSASPQTTTTTPTSYLAQHPPTTTAGSSLRPRLHTSIISFLETAHVLPVPSSSSPLFFFVAGISPPQGLFADFVADMHSLEQDALLCLYEYNVGGFGQAGGGLYYHQGIHKAAVFMHGDAIDAGMPVREGLWVPLEVILSSWIDMVRVGKVAVGEDGEGTVGPWRWCSFGAGQVARCVEAWEGFCRVVEERGGRRSRGGEGEGEGDGGRIGLVGEEVLERAGVRRGSFVWEFLRRARRPSWKRVAPGLVAPEEGDGFEEVQGYRGLEREGDWVLPVCLFPAVREEGGYWEVDAHGLETGGFGPDGYEGTERPLRVTAGVYSEAVDRGSYDVAEEGFRLLLPFGLAGGVWQGPGTVVEDDEGGARKSDGSFVTPGSVDELFQHGYKPFGGEVYRAQRLERLFDHWRTMIEEGVWEVGEEGVQGTVEAFREADLAWRDYVIPPSW